MTEAMRSRADVLGKDWKYEGGGYFSIHGFISGSYGGSEVAYIALPNGHPSIGTDWDDFNGYPAFAEGNVYGWDYRHGDSDPTAVENDITSALNHFRAEEGRT